jgi:hypothetical protein
MNYARQNVFDNEELIISYNIPLPEATKPFNDMKNSDRVTLKLALSE